jgi:hypothetical protein
MVLQREVSVKLKIDPDFLRKEQAAKQEAAKSKLRSRDNGMSPCMQRKIREAMARAEAAGRPITDLTVAIIRDIMNDRL